MADRKATNKYYPKEYFDYLESGGKKSLNLYQNQHPLRERTRFLSQGILIIRFEIPFNIWCDGCGKMIGKGTRFNAQKKKTGTYFSTPIYSFRMKCHECDNWFEIRTDPENRDYLVVPGGGAQKKTMDFDPKDANTYVVHTDRGHRSKDEFQQQLQNEDDDYQADTVQTAASNALVSLDPMARLEKEVVQTTKAQQDNAIIRGIKAFNDSRYLDDYASSQSLRKKFRQEKQSINDKAEADKKLSQKLSFSLPLASPSTQDILVAKQAFAQNREKIIMVTNTKSSAVAKSISKKGKTKSIFSTKHTHSSKSTLSRSLKKETKRKYEAQLVKGEAKKEPELYS